MDQDKLRAVADGIERLRARMDAAGFMAHRFKAEPDRTRSQTWKVIDKTTGKAAPGMINLSADSAKDWAKGMNERNRSGQKIMTYSEDLDPV